MTTDASTVEITIPDEELKQQSGVGFAKGDSTTDEHLRRLCDHTLLTPKEEQTIAIRLQFQRRKLWESLQQHPALQAVANELKIEPQEDGSPLPATPHTRTALTVYSTIKKSLQRKNPEYEQQYKCTKQEAETALEESRTCYKHYRKTREQLAHHNGKLLVSIALRLRGLGLPLDDLLQEGHIGLMDAVDHFEWRETRFSTYATRVISGAMMEAITDQSREIRLTETALQRILALNAAEAILGKKAKGNEDEIAQHLNQTTAPMRWNAQEVRDVCKWRKGKQLKSMHGQEGEAQLVRTLVAATHTPDEILIRIEKKTHAAKAVRTAIAATLKRQKKNKRKMLAKDDLPLWRMYHIAQMDYKTIAAKTGLTREKVKTRIGRIGRLIEAQLKKMSEEPT
jgi:RNA polymerase sigma factor (sigma-70 family)